MDKKANISVCKECINLFDCKTELNFNRHDMEQQIEKDQDLMQKLTSEISPISRRNFESKRTLSVLEKSWPLFIQNMISLTELNDMTSGAFTPITSDKKQQLTSPLLGKKKLYEQLFYILQKEPKYMAALAQHVKPRQATDYVKTIVFDIYGDQYDYGEERLLLTLFQMVLKQYFDEAQDITSILKRNVVATQMLSAYTQRGQALYILRGILEKPIREMLGQTSLNCEINPVEVYKQIVISYESKMNKPWPEIRNATSNEAADNKYVKKLIPPRIKQLEYIAKHFIQRIIDTVDSVPFGIRWICRDLVEMTQQRFPQVDQVQIDGVVGRYIYLQFYNPILILPESIGITKQISKRMRRNLILVAKILQHLFTGDEFGDKFMRPFSKFIEVHRQDIQSYFARLIDIKSLLENKRGRDHTIQISFKQISLIHQLLLKHTDQWNPDNNTNDPVLKLLNQLGPATDNNSMDISINMRLSPHDDEKHDINEPNTTITIFEAKSNVPLVNSIRDGIQSVLLNKSIPQTFFDRYGHSLKAFLYNVQEWARNRGNNEVLTDINATLSNFNKYIASEHCAQVNESQIFNNCLVVYVNEIADIRRRINRFHLKVISMANTRDIIIDRANYLQTKLQYYQNNQSAKTVPSISNNKTKKREKKKSYTPRDLECLVSGYLKKNLSEELLTKYPTPLSNIFVDYLSIPVIGKPKKFSHNALIQQKIIVDVDENILRQTKANFNNLVYYFNKIGIDEFEVDIKYRVGFGATISPFPEPFPLSLSKLVEMKEGNALRYELEIVTMNVTLLINLLNKSFAINKFNL